MFSNCQALKRLANCSTTSSVTCDFQSVDVEDIVLMMSNSKPYVNDIDLFPDGFSFDRLNA